MENDLVIAVIDACRKSAVECDKDELANICEKDDLVVYKAIGSLCQFCSGNELSPRGIGEHGAFCANIIRRAFQMAGARILPHLAIYAVGCPSCSGFGDTDIALAIREAVKDKVKVISVSLMRHLPSRYVDLDDSELHTRDFAAIEAMEKGALVVTSAGFYGHYGLCTIQKAIPCCLTVGSCTSYRGYKTDIFIETIKSKDCIQFEGYSSSPVATASKFVWRRRIKKDEPCVMHFDGEYIVIEAAEGANTPNPESLVFIPKETANEVLFYISQMLSPGEKLVATLSSTLRNDLNNPSISKTSGRGPCFFYKEYMKPDLCAPGEHIVAAWLPDDPLKRDYEGPARYLVQSGTSFATPYVAAGVAAIMAEKNFSPSAAFSAAITTADRMHGSDIDFEFAYGAGAFNWTKAMQPGLVYEEAADAYIDIFTYPCHPNLPYISATFPLSSGGWGCRFDRRLKNVEEGSCTYTSEVVVHATTLSMPCEFVRITVHPESLSFEGLNEEQKFFLTVDLPHTNSKEKFAVVSCSLKWTNKDDVNIVVESPIILSSQYTSVHVFDRH